MAQLAQEHVEPARQDPVRAPRFRQRVEELRPDALPICGIDMQPQSFERLAQFRIGVNLARQIERQGAQVTKPVPLAAKQ